jgi:hypothetical protein
LGYLMFPKFSFKLTERLDVNRKQWKQHLERIGVNRFPKKTYNYKPEGRRNVGRPRSRWKDQH